MISKLLKLKHPIIKIDLFSKDTFEVEVHPTIENLMKTDRYIKIHWILMYKLSDFTCKVLNTDV